MALSNRQSDVSVVAKYTPKTLLSRQMLFGIHTVTDVTLYVIYRIFNRQNIYQQVLVRIYLRGLFDIQL